MLTFIDTHSHITDDRYDINDIQRHWEANNISNVFAVSAEIKDLDEVINIAHQIDSVYAIIGLHPDDADKYSEDIAKKIETLAQDDKVVAIGEIGLDYHYIDSNDFDTKRKQKEMFVSQIMIADRLNLPIMIHERDACKDLIDTIEEYKDYITHGMILHCYSESYETYQILKKYNCAIGVGGVVTFKNGKKLQEVVTKCDIDDIILETDCPYLSPEPHRGETNEPKNIIHIAEKVCELRGISMEELSQATNANIKRLFPKFRG
jgi:TatD DNase family protein